MNTLKMKVLLMMSDRYLYRAVRQALLIWISTCIGGCAVLYSTELLMFPPATSIILSLIFSSPALLVAVPFLYHLSSFPTVLSRIASATGLILFTSAGVIGFVSVFFNLRYAEVAETLLLFIPTAFACFILIAWKQLTKSYVKY